MEMMDMKMPKKSKKEMMGAVTSEPSDSPQYPYGLQLSLDTDALKKLSGLDNVEVGEEVEIMAMATVTSIRKEKMQDGKENNRVELQITKMNAMCESDYEGAWDKANGEKE